MSQPSAMRVPHPWAYMVLFLPFGMTSGYVVVTLAYLLTKAGASVEAVAALAAVSILPSTWKVLWAPLIDTTLTAKRWYMISVAVTAAAVLATAFLPYRVDMLPVFTAAAFAIGFTVTFAAMSVERLMAHATAEHQKGRAGGWSQAGNIGGQGLGGGAALWIAQHSGVSWLAGAALALACLASALPLLGVHEPAPAADARRYLRILQDSAIDLLALVRTRLGVMACFICLLPLGSGAAQNLWAAIAGDWGAGADEVALVGGVLSGVVCVAGAIFGGYVCDRVGRKRGYVVFGLVSAATALVMAAGPRTPLAFMALATLYNLVIGLVYGGFSAVTLEAIGKGAAATKYNLVASLSNIPLLLMTLADGWAHARWGSSGMLVFEAAIGVTAATVYGVTAYATRGLTWPARGRPKPA